MPEHVSGSVALVSGPIPLHIWRAKYTADRAHLSHAFKKSTCRFWSCASSCLKFFWLSLSHLFPYLVEDGARARNRSFEGDEHHIESSTMMLSTSTKLAARDPDGAGRMAKHIARDASHEESTNKSATGVSHDNNVAFHLPRKLHYCLSNMTRFDNMRLDR